MMSIWEIIFLGLFFGAIVSLFCGCNLKDGVVFSGSFCFVFTLVLVGAMEKGVILEVGSPIVEETRYEVLDGSDTTRVSGSISGNLYHIACNASEDSFYKIYYAGVNSDGEKIAIPFTVKESQTEIVILPDDAQDEYLLEQTTVQTYEYKNKDIDGMNSGVKLRRNISYT